MIKTSCAKIRRQNHPNITLLPTWAFFCHKNTSFCMTWHIVDCALSAGSKPIVNVVGCPTGYNQPNSNTPNKMVTQKVLYTGSVCAQHTGNLCPIHANNPRQNDAAVADDWCWGAEPDGAWGGHRRKRTLLDAGRGRVLESMA